MKKLMRTYASKKWGPTESRGRKKKSKCIEHKDHSDPQPTMFWPRSKGTYVRGKE